MAAANLNSVRATIEGRLATELADTTGGKTAISVAFHNMPYEPTPGSSWVQCLVSFGANEYLSQGLTTNSQNRIVGLLTMNIFTAKGVGPGANYVIAKRIRDLYNRVIVSGVYFDAVNGPSVLAAPAPEGYFQTQVRVTFEFIEDL
tara:strand:+ start:6140 stop:6577 length:438 start_codon:yes stop_codon:yes gene_type:complete